MHPGMVRASGTTAAVTTPLPCFPLPATLCSVQVRIISFGVMLFLPMTIGSLAVLLPVNFTSGAP